METSTSGWRRSGTGTSLFAAGILAATIIALNVKLIVDQIVG